MDVPRSTGSRSTRPLGTGADFPPSSAVADVVRPRLRAEHLRIESRLRLPESVSTSADYARLLDLWALVWGAVAATADETSEPGRTLAELSARAHERLTTDRVHLPGTAPVTAPVELSVGPGTACGWGVAYVLAGSSLGNRVLQPLILGRLGGAHPSAYRYLAGDGSDVRRHWRQICARLDRWAATAAPGDVEHAVNAGAATFQLVADAADAVGWPAATVADAVVAFS